MGLDNWCNIMNNIFDIICSSISFFLLYREIYEDFFIEIFIWKLWGNIWCI